jgi:hypothetical protein
LSLCAFSPGNPEALETVNRSKRDDGEVDRDIEPESARVIRSFMASTFSLPDVLDGQSPPATTKNAMSTNGFGDSIWPPSEALCLKQHEPFSILPSRLCSNLQLGAQSVTILESRPC